MPNGCDKNWVRLCAAIDGFRSRYGRWPSQVRLRPIILEDLRDNVFTQEGFEQVAVLVRFVPDDETWMVAEDGTGAGYDYEQEGFPEEPPDISAADWLGRPAMRPDPDVHG
jgi:hypothetical protein